MFDPDGYPVKPRLHHPTSIALASMFGTCVAGGVLIGLNLRILDRSRTSLWILTGIVAQVLLALLGWAIPTATTRGQIEVYVAMVHLVPAALAGIVAWSVFREELRSHRGLPVAQTVQVGWICWALQAVLTMTIWLAFLT